MRWVLLLVAFAVGCYDSHGTKLPDDYATCDEPQAPSAAPPELLTYYQHAKPIIDAKCATCHQPGDIGPFSLTSYEDAFLFNADMRRAIEMDIMPPWLPDECCRDYEWDRSLTPDERATLLGWIDQGAQAGNPDDPAPPLDYDWGELSRVDAELAMPEPFDPIPTVGADEIRCFQLDWPYDETTYVTGINVIPGNRTMVHHVIVFVVDADESDDLADLENDDDRPGWDCWGELGARPEGSIGGWAPGYQGVQFPKGLGRKVKAGSTILLQVHYDTGARSPEPDRTTLQVMVDDEVEREARSVGIVNPLWLVGDGMHIPAGEPDVMYNFSYDPTVVFGKQKPLELFNVNIHMHELGASGSVAVLRKDGTVECLLEASRYDFYWTGEYWFDEPVILEPGDELYVECHFDNTAANQKIVNGELQPPRDIAWGTDEEMCAAVTLAAEVD